MMNDIKKINSNIKENEMVILYFSNNVCDACEVIREKVGLILKDYSNVIIIDIDVEKQSELSAMYNVFSSPLLILFVNGKETIRVGRNVDFLELEKNIKRYYDMLF